jgi:hypothetical protein
VNQENATALESNNQILAATLDRCDPFAFELGRDCHGVVRSCQSAVEDGDALELPPDEKRLQVRADRLDLR